MTSDSIFVPGKPLTDIWAAPGLRWKAQLAAAIPGALRHPRLRFVRNDHNHFDLDNLAYPALVVAGCAACESVWASVTQGAAEGVSITEELPPPPPASAVSIRIENPNTASVATRPPPPELTAVEVVAPGRRLGLALEFDDADVAVGELSYEGPTKSLIDDLGPLLGVRPYRGRLVSDDERIKELRITRGHRPGGRGVRVALWPLED